jgi:pimeloyl-[acyl-carrier protein] methyl ester esterase
VLLPGMDGTGRLFAEFVNALSGEFEIAVESYPTDACRSYSELKESVLSLLPKSDSYALLAESFSSPLAIQCAAENHENLKALILCAGFSHSPLNGWSRFLVSLFAPIVSHFKLPAIAVRSLLIGRDAPETLLSAVQGAVSSVPPRVLAARIRAILVCDVRNELAQVRVPILYLRATEDKLVRVQSMEEILRIKPDMKVISIAGPHLLIQREPRRTAEVVVDYFRRLEGTSITLDSEN